MLATINVNSSSRILAMIPAACIVTLLLLYLMHRLIDVEPVDITEAPPIKVLSFVMEKPVIEIRKKMPEKPIEPQVEPNKPPIEVTRLETTDNSLIIPDYRFRTGINPKVGLNQGSTLIRTVTAPPQYPSGPLARGIEGYVDIAFDVTAYGATTNIRILDSQPQDAFDKAAVRAVKRWKYKPLYVEGVATPSYGIKERIRFSIES